MHTHHLMLAKLVLLFLCVGQQALPAVVHATEQPPVQKGASSETQRFEKEGISMEFSLSLADSETDQPRLVSGHDAIARFRIADASTGAPITGVRPRAWFSARRSEMVANETQCVDKVRAVAGGGLTARADVDLNSYLLLTMNHDKTVSFINPQVAFSKTKLESIVELPTIGADWVLSADKNFLYVTLPDESAVAIIDTVARKLLKTLSTGQNSKPTRVALQPNGRYVWVGLDGASQVAAIDTATNQLQETVGAGVGLHNLAMTADSRYLYVTNSDEDSVSVIDTRRLAKMADIKVGKTPVAIAFGDASRMVYVASLNGETIDAIHPERQKIVATLPTKPGIVDLRFEPQGRYAIAVNQIDSTVSVLDSANNSITITTAVVKDPHQVTFTQAYAYIRGIGSEKFSLIDLKELRQGRLRPLDIQAGLLPPSAEPKEIGVAAMIAPSPEGNSVMIGNAADRVTYFYQEGMMAPMGTFSNYKRMARGVMILDRSLAETAPGVYSAPIKLPRGGRFDVPLLIDQPRVVHCFQVTVQESPEQMSVASRNRPPLVRALFGKESISAHTPTALQFTLLDAATQQPVAGVKDVQVLLFEPPGTWQQRHWAKEVEAGRYAVTQSFPHAGEYRVMIQSPSQHLRFVDATSMVLTVVPSSKGSSSAATASHNR